MAYMSFAPELASGGSIRQAAPATPADVERFSPLELRVIGLAARSDVTREIDHQSRFGRFVEWAFGNRLDRPLADPRLERLRRFASLAVHHPEEVTPDEVAGLVGAGFSPGQALGLYAYLAGESLPARPAHFV